MAAVARPGLWSHPLGRDVVIACAVAGWVWAAVAVAGEPAVRSSAVAGWALGALVGVLQLGRRRFPLSVLVLCAAVVVAYHALGFPGIGPTWPLLVSYGATAAAGHLSGAGVLAGSLAVSTVLWRVLAESDPLLPVLLGAGQDVVLAGLALAVGDAVRQRRRWAAEVAARLAVTEQAARRRARQQFLEQRLAIAADLHDGAGHHLVLLGLQLRLAQETLDRDPTACRRALEAALAAHDDALRETTATVRLLHHDDPAAHEPSVPGPALADLHRLRDVAALAGLRLHVDVHVEEAARLALPVPVAAVAYRIGQEALTNTLRHSRATCADLTVTAGEELHLRFHDDGPPGRGGRGESSGGGLGIPGMRARAAGVGGTLHAGPAGSGYLVEACLPLPAPEAGR